MAIIVSFITYLAFFAWLGFRRGLRREAIVAGIAAVALIILQERSDVVINVANLFGAAYSFATAGGFSGSADEAFAAIASAPDLVSDDSRTSFFFVGWSLLFVMTYALTHLAVQDKDSPRNGWALLLGVLNGLFFGVVFVPGLVALFGTDETLPDLGADLNLLDLLSAGFALVWNGVSSLWALIESAGSLGLLIILTLLLVLAAGSIKGNARAKS